MAWLVRRGALGLMPFHAFQMLVSSKLRLVPGNARIEQEQLGRLAIGSAICPMVPA